MNDSIEFTPAKIPDLTGRRIVVAVTGGIAVYKAVDLCSRLRKAGAEIRVTMTESATRFVTPLTFEAIANYPAVTSLFERTRAWEMDHIADARWAELVVVAPATANIIAKMSAGIADDPVSTLALAYEGPMLIAPAMNSSMYRHPATTLNLRLLVDRGVEIIEPASGRLACGEIGPGRLADVEDIVDAIATKLQRKNDLRGKKVLITAGPTREFVDPARFLSNPSTGRMGYALAREAASRGAEVVLVTGPTELSVPSGATVERIVSTAEMLAAVQHHFPDCDLAIFAGAPADYRPAETATTKSPKADSLQLNLVPTDDIATWAGQNRREGQILIAFAAETHDAEKHGFEKMKRKNADFIVVNNISRDDIGFASEDNEVVILGKDNSRHLIPKSSKGNIAKAILDHCVVARQE